MIGAARKRQRRSLVTILALEQSAKAGTAQIVFIGIGLLAGRVKLTAKDKQVGGDHYKNLKIQPVEYIMANNLNYCEGNVIKYVTRYKQKGGIIDLEKAKHYIDLLIQEVQDGIELEADSGNATQDE